MTNNMYETHTDEKYLELFCNHLYSNFGIFTNDTHKSLLLQKLKKLMREANIESLAEYYHNILSPPITQGQKDMINKFIDTITVHKTNFFREMSHYTYIKNNINKILQNSSVNMTKEIRVWSAACSTGEEPYTLAMTLKECLPKDYTAKILATDISPKVLQSAMVGEYTFSIEDNLSQEQMHRYFTKKENNKWVICDEIKSSVTFRLFNLMSPFPFKKPFDIIFCKNVMIYFDKKVQEVLVNKFYDSLSENGLLFIGHSESLMQLKHNYKYAQPTIYQKPGIKEGSLCR